MSLLWCLDCQKSFDALQGHNCVKSCVIQGTVNRHNANFQTIVDRQYGTSPITSTAIEEEINTFTSTSTKLRKANIDCSLHTSLNDLATNSNDQLNYSSQECTSKIMNRELLIAISEATVTSNLESECNEIAMALGTADHLIPNKVGTNTPCNEHPNVSRDQKPRNEKPMAEIHHQFSKQGQTAQKIVRGENLRNRTNVFAFKETEPNQHFNAPNSIPAVNITKDTASYTLSFNTRMRWEENEVEKIPRGCPSATSENKLTFNDKTRDSGQKETATKEISTPRSSESAQSYSIVDASAVSGPSCSQNIGKTCSVCHKKFSTVQNLKKHVLTHSGEKPFTCVICQKVFTQNGHLKGHMLVHSGEKPHRCDVCGKCFARKRNLKSHLLIHVDVKPYKCETCDKTFKRSSGLKVHICRERKVTL